MAKTEKPKLHKFYILNVKLRRGNSMEDVDIEDYVRLFRDTIKSKLHAESSPGKHCIFRFLFEEKENGNVIFQSGTFAQFTYIENERWFSLDSLDIDKEFHVPKGLFPDAVITDFVFIPSAHRFCFRVASGINISPYPVKKFLESVLDKASKPNELVQVDVESQRKSIDEILSAKEIKKLVIDVNYSNFDNTHDIQKYFEDDIKKANTEKIKIEVTQKPGVSLEPKDSKIILGALETSISNGETTANIIDDNNELQTIKTSDFPNRQSVYGLINAFPQLVYDKIIRIFRPNGR